MQSIIAGRKSFDDRLYAFSYPYGTSGSGPESQPKGHPNAAEQKELSDALVAFLIENGIYDPQTGSVAPKS